MGMTRGFVTRVAQPSGTVALCHKRSVGLAGLLREDLRIDRLASASYYRVASGC